MSGKFWCGALVLVLLFACEDTYGDGSNGQEEVDLGRVTQVAAGWHYSLALNEDGELYSWGGGGRSSRPKQVKTLDNSGQPLDPQPTWKTLAAGWAHSLALTTSGELYSWGNNNEGQLGLGSTDNKSSPQLVKVDSGSFSWKAVAAGDDYSLALASSGELYSWGDNDDGQLGLGSTGNRENSPQLVQVLDNTGSALNPQPTWQTLAAGDDHSLAISSKGELYSWGDNFYGQLGLGSTDNKSSPQQVGDQSNWKAVATGQRYSLALTSSGKLYSWGNNYSGQLGLGDSGEDADRHSPQLVKLLDNSGQPLDQQPTWKALAAGGSHSLAMTTDNKLYSWGFNGTGQLGLGTSGTGTEHNSPQRVDGRSDWQTLAGGFRHSLAASKSGELYSWGNNGWSQLGLGNADLQNRPQQVGGKN